MPRQPTLSVDSVQLWGPDLYKQRVMELNASDERGIKVVQEKVKAFASLAVGNGVAGYPCPPFKVAILSSALCMSLTRHFDGVHGHDGSWSSWTRQTR